jgi:hypothetical protein
MAVFNEILAGRFNRGLQKIFAIKGTPPVRQLGGEITPGHVIGSGVENRYPEGWERFGNGVVTLAVAAQTWAFRFRNPPNSGMVAVLEVLAATNLGGADTIQLTNSIAPQVDLATLDSGAQLDIRSRPNSSLIISHVVAAPTVTLTTQRAIAARQSQAITMVEFILFEDQEITILPGMTYQIQSVAANLNQAAVCTYIWRERPLEESERS